MAKRLSKESVDEAVSLYIGGLNARETASIVGVSSPQTVLNQLAKAGVQARRPNPSSRVDGRKQCAKCKEHKTEAFFSRNKSTSDGFGAWCKLCMARANKAYNAAQYACPEGRKKINARGRWTRYKITPADFEAMVLAQNGKCKICDEVPANKPHFGLHVDHCHTTGKIRGLLCFHCNAGIGHFKDKPSLIKQALKYLEDT